MNLLNTYIKIDWRRRLYFGKSHELCNPSDFIFWSIPLSKSRYKSNNLCSDSKTVQYYSNLEPSHVADMFPSPGRQNTRCLHSPPHWFLLLEEPIVWLCARFVALYCTWDLDFVLSRVPLHVHVQALYCSWCWNFLKLDVCLDSSLNFWLLNLQLTCRDKLRENLHINTHQLIV